MDRGPVSPRRPLPGARGAAILPTMRGWTRFRPIGVFILALGCLGADGDYVRVHLETPAPSPYQRVIYEVTERGRTTTVVHRKEVSGVTEGLHGVRLLTRQEAAALWRAVDSLDALALKDALASTPGVGQLTWGVTVRREGRVHTFRVTDPVNQADRRYGALFTQVRDVSVGTAGPLPFRNVFFDSDRLGWLNIVSVPSARVRIDGFDTQHTSPLYGYEVEAGVHELELVSLDGVYTRTYRVKVEPMGTTHLQLDLR